MRRLALLFVVTLGASATSAFAATLSVTSWHLWSGSQTLTKTTCTVTGAALDTYVDQSNATSSFGTQTFIGTRPDSGAVVWSFVKFDLSSCSLPTTAGADTATLKLWMTTAPGTNRTLTVNPVLTSWPNTLTWNGAQALSYGATTTTFTTGTAANVTRSATVTIDVDNLIKNSTASYGWRIRDAGSTATGNTTVFSSSDAAANKPQLVINYEK